MFCPNSLTLWIFSSHCKWTDPISTLTWKVIDVGQKWRKSNPMSSSLSGYTHRFVSQPIFIRLYYDHQELPGKCFNLPTLIQNARTLNQAAQSKYPSCFFGFGCAEGLHSSPSLTLFWSTVALTPHSSIHYRNTLQSTEPGQHVFVKYLSHALYNEKHTPCPAIVL